MVEKQCVFLLFLHPNCISAMANGQKTPEKQNEQELKENLDRVNMWIGNCDQKASFLLALVGIVLTVVCTSDAISGIKTILIRPFMSYWREGMGTFCLLRTIIAILLIAGFVCVIISIVYLLLCLRAKTEYDSMKKQGMEEKSLLFYGSVAKMSYSDYCEAENDRINDLRTQVYINSVICDKKFENYKNALRLVLWALPFLVFGFLIMLFV